MATTNDIWSDSVIFTHHVQIEFMGYLFYGTIIVVWGVFDCQSDVLLRFTQVIICLVVTIKNPVIWFSGFLPMLTYSNL